MTVISFVSSKGGVGKTTGSVVLAGELLAAGKSVTLIDADPNRPLMAWAQLGALPANLKLIADESAETIIDTIDEARRSTDYVIVDLEGTATDRVGFAVTRSDLVLIPVQGSVLDANEAAKSVKLVRQMSRVAGRDVPYRIYFSKMAAAIRERTARDIENQFTANKVPTLPIALLDRAAFRAMFSLGGTLHDLNAKHVSGLASAKDNALAFAQAAIDILKVAAAA
jgi:chromosome partitioning protein